MVKLVLLGVFVMAGCGTLTADNPSPGVFRIPHGGSSFSLKGWWLFQPAGSLEWNPIRVPGYWNHTFGMDGLGMGVYRCTVEFPRNVRGRQDRVSVSIEVGEVQSAYRLFVDGTPLGGLGDVETDREEGAEIHPARFTTTVGDQATIEIQVRSTLNPIGGLGEAPVLSLGSALYTVRLLEEVLYLFFSTGIAFFLVYFLVKVFLSSSKAVSAFLSATLFFALIRDNLLNKRLLLTFFPGMSTPLSTRLEYLTIIGIAIAFSGFLWKFSEDRNFQKIFWTILTFGIVYIVLLFSVPFKLFIDFFRLFIFLCLGSLVFTVFNIIMIQRNKHTRLFLLSMLLPIASGTYDLIQGFFMMSNIYLFSTSLTIFLLFQSVLIQLKQKKQIDELQNSLMNSIELQKQKQDLLFEFIEEYRSRIDSIERLCFEITRHNQSVFNDNSLIRLKEFLTALQQSIQGEKEVDWELLYRQFSRQDMSSVAACLPEVCSPSRCLLAVDDEPINRTLVRTWFEKRGVKVILAENGERSLELAQSQRPDWILLDVMMRPIDGFKTLKRLRSKLRPLPPVVFQSALDDRPYLSRALTRGAIGFASKPLPYEEIYHYLTIYSHLLEQERLLGGHLHLARFRVIPMSCPESSRANPERIAPRYLLKACRNHFPNLWYSFCHTKVIYLGSRKAMPYTLLRLLVLTAFAGQPLCLVPARRDLHPSALDTPSLYLPNNEVDSLSLPPRLSAAKADGMVKISLQPFQRLL